jgi:7-cyano-7-deazaguanine synthase in queuosine biosynthesis
MEKETLVICISGGLDSFTMYHYANKVFNKDNRYNIKYLSVIDEDSPYWAKECAAIEKLYGNSGTNRKFYENFSFVNLKGYGKLAKTEDHVVLGRNAVIASIASALGENIWMGGTYFEDNIGMYDKNEMFWHEMTRVLTQACGYKRKNTTVWSPFQNRSESWDKHNMIVWLESQGIKEWRNTVSCFHPTQLRCGTCAVCYKRYIYEKFVEIKHGIKYSNEAELEDTYFQNPLENFFLGETIAKMQLAIRHNDYLRYYKERIGIYNEVLKYTGVISKGVLE